MCFRKIERLLSVYSTSTLVELQQRSVEYKQLLTSQESARCVQSSSPVVSDAKFLKASSMCIPRASLLGRGV